MYKLPNDGHYSMWNERAIIADCLSDIGLKDLAPKAMNPSTSTEIISKYLSIITSTANAQRRHDVLERLHFAGLIYG